MQRAGRSRSTMAPARPRITPPVGVGDLSWITCSVWTWNACSGWSPGGRLRVAVGAEPNTVSGADAARARLASSAPDARRARRSSWAITSLIGTASASATATGMARSRNGSAERSATCGPMMLPPAPKDADRVTTGAMRCSLPPVAWPRGARLPAMGVAALVRAGPLGAAPGC